MSAVARAFPSGTAPFTIAVSSLQLGTVVRHVDVRFAPGFAPYIEIWREALGTRCGSMRVFGDQLALLARAIRSARAGVLGLVGVSPMKSGCAVAFEVRRAGILEIGLRDPAGAPRGGASRVGGVELDRLAEAHRIAAWDGS